jgi:Family of unknown function (DUF6159)
MGRIARSFALVKESWRVLMMDKELFLLPVISGAILIVLVGSWFFAIGPAHLEGKAMILPVFLLYVIAYTVSIYFQSAVIAGALERLRGGDPTLRSALGAASSRLPTIVLWGLVAATVGLVLRMIENRSEAVGRFVSGLLGAAWTLMTFFVVPVIVVERAPVGTAMRRSLSLFKETWGESVSGGIGLGLLGILVMLPVGAVCVLLGNAGFVYAAIAVGVLGAAVAGTVMSALQGVFVAALYRYATTGAVGAGVDPELLQQVFRPKR